MVTDYQQKGVSVAESIYNTTTINNCKNQLVVVDGIDNVLIVNIQEAVHIEKYDHTSGVKQILSRYPQIQHFADKGNIFYRKRMYIVSIDVEHQISNTDDGNSAFIEIEVRGDHS